MHIYNDVRRSGVDLLPRVLGAGGGGGKNGGGSASSAPDTLFSTATVRLVDLLGEGEIVGVRGGLKGVYLNDVPVQNEDGSFNFKGLTAEFRVGTPDQPYMAGYPDVQTPRNVGIKVNQATPVTASITDTDVDRLRVTIQVPSLFLAKSDGSVRANSVSYRVEARYSGGPWVNSLGDQTITGKTTSGYFRSHEIALPTNPSGASAPWQVRVTRLSPDTDDFNNNQAKFTNQSDLVFYSTTSIVDARFSYPHSAMVGLTAQASSFGSSVPGRTYLVDGVLMPIPSNYDPVARTYSGVWDGTFKEGFSNNPAWALNLILRNDRFGLGEFIDVAAIDKWSLYEIGRYCDVPVSDGKGGQEPSYVFNGAISTQQEAFELLQLIAQVFRGTVYWSSGTVTAAQDRPSDPVLLVTEANALEGENGEAFAYASSGRRARHTVALVAWNDPDNLYKQTIEVVEDSDGVARYGYNPTRIDLLGCTSRGQAHRTGLWTLFTELHQTQVLTYRAGLDHAVIRPGDIVAVQDPQISNLDLSGRLMGGSTASVLVLDRPVTLASGAAYTVSVVMPDGTVQEREISTGAGTVSSVTLRSALPQVPDPAAVWLIAGPLEPQLFRVVSIREEEPHIYAVAALQHEPGKYATIDDGAAFEPSPITDFPNIVLPPTNLSVRESQYTELGQPKQAMTLSWLPGQAFNSVAYFVTVIRPSGATVTTRTASQSIDFLEAEVGVWTFVVVAIGLNGKSSLPAQTTYTLSGWAGQAATTVAGLSVKGGGSTFTGRSCTVAWTNQIAASVPPYPVRNVVYVFDASTQVMVHREVLPAGVTEWTYDYFLNVNEGGPRRQFRVGVTAYSAAGDEGPPSYLTVSNPAPEIIVPTLGSTSEVLFVDLPKVADADFAGYLVWVSETSNINPLTAPSYDVAGNSFPYRGVPDKTYYVRAAAYDAFSKDPALLNVSAEQSKKLTIQLFDPLAPPIPGTPILASNSIDVAPDGTVTSRIIVSWPAVTSTNLATYEVAIAEGNNPAQAAYVGGRFVSGTTAAFAGLMPGRQYSFKVRSNPLNGFADSGWSAVLVVTAALNTTPPAAPTAFTATASFEAANLAWTNPTNKDLFGVEVWAGTTNVLANAVLLKTMPSPAAFYRDVLGTTATKFYWIRSVNTSDFKSGYVGPLSVTSAALAAAQLAAGVIDATKLASSIAANTVVAALPATKTTAYVTLGDEQYRWDAAAGRYTKAVSATDIAGKVAAAQIDTINAPQIAGQVQASQVAALEASKITGALTADQIASLPATKITGALTSAQIASLDAAKLAGQIVATQITDGAITTAKIGAAQVVAGNIAAGAVTASKLSIGSMADNIVPNGDMEEVSGNQCVGWSVISKSTAGQIYSYTAAPFNGTSSMILEKGTNVADGNWVEAGSRGLNVTGGATYEVACYTSPMDQVSAAGFYLRVYWFDKDGAAITPSQTDVFSNAAIPGGWSRRAGQVVAPAAARRAQVSIYNWQTSTTRYLAVDAVSMRQASSATHIENGAITTDKLTANAVTTGKLAAGAVTANEIAANAVVTAKIAAGAIVTAHMTAGTINADRLVAQSITAGLIAASTITGDKIAGRTVSAGNIVTGTLTGNEIQANSVNADRLVANSITTAQIAAGAIKAGQIDAAAITADKLGVGLNTGNLIWNSDREVAGFVSFVPAAGVATGEGNSDWTVSGQKGIAILAGGANPSAKLSYADLLFPLAAGGTTPLVPVQAGRTYEWTCYLSAHRCRAYIEAHWWNGSQYAVAGYGSNIENVQGVGAPNDVWRSRLKVTAPADAVGILLRIVQVTNGGTDAYLVASAPYFGLVPDGTPAGTYSAYAPQSRTIISGGQIATNSLHANRITAGTITTDRVATGGLHADRIQSGTITTTQIQAGGVHADRIQAGTITATQIAANSITAGRLNIEVRGIMPVNVYFEMERDGNGNATGWLKWTAGQVEWIDDNGNRAFSGIPAGRMQRGSDGWVTVWFDKAAPGQLWANPGNNIPAIRANPNLILVATSADLTGVIVNWGGTVIDGDKITANSIQARNIAANQIQTFHMAANSISGDRIQAGTLSADRITTGTLTTSSTISLGASGQTDIVAFPEGGTMRVRNRALNQWRAAFGYLGPWTGDGDDFGLLLWGADGVNRVRFSNAINFIDGAVILDATITSAKIGSLQVKSANIEDLTVGNSKITDFAVSTITAASSPNRDTTTNIVSRSGNSRFLILAFFNGNSNAGSTLGPGAFNISRNGAQLTNVNASFALFKPDSGNLQFYLNSMCIGVIDQPGQGTISYSCFHSNGQGVGGVTIVAMELAK